MSDSVISVIKLTIDDYLIQYVAYLFYDFILSVPPFVLIWLLIYL